MKLHTIVTSCVVCCLFSSSSVEGGVMSLSGDIETLAPPFSVQENAVESADNARLILERENVLLSQILNVDITTSGVFDEPIDTTPGSIAAGTRVNSYLIHADGPDGELFVGSVVFGQTILGLIITEENLQASHSILGSPLTTYPANNSADAADAPLTLGIFGEELTLNLPANQLDFTLSKRVSDLDTYDHIRVITAVPEPSSLVLCGIGALALALGYRVKSSRRVLQREA